MISEGPMTAPFRPAVDTSASSVASPSELKCAAWVLLLAVLYSIGPSRLVAQIRCCTISGKVANRSGRAVSGALISAKSHENKQTQQVVSSTDGSFVLANLSPGIYSVTASAADGTTASIEVMAHSGAPGLVMLTLDTGQNPSVATTVLSRPTSSSEKVRDIPLNGRSATDIATLEPGVTAARTQPSAGTAQQGFGAQITISGGRPRQNDSRLNGISVNDYANSPPGSAAGVNLGVDAVEGVSVLSSDYPAQYGRSSGGIISSNTRSGAKGFHGSVFEFFRNSALDARNYFDLQKPSFSRNQFGGTLGGSLWRQRTFLFGAYEGFRQSLGISQVSVVPSSEARAGHLSSGNIVPDRTALSFINAFYPLPNGALQSSGDTGTYNFAGQQVVPENYFNSRLDQKLSHEDEATGTYMYDAASVRQPDEFNNKGTGYDSQRQLVTLNEVHTTANMSNSLRFGISRIVAATGLNFVGSTPLASDGSFAAVPGQNAPAVKITGLTEFTGGIGTPSRFNFHWTSIQGYDDLTVTRGKSILKFGAGVERMRDNVLSRSTPGGLFDFNSLADFLQNRPLSLEADLPGIDTERGIRQTVGSVYAQGEFSVDSHLKVDIGLRYEIASVPTEVHNRLTVLRNLTDATPHLGAPLFANPTLHNVEPRVGVSFSPSSDGKSVIRAGFGVFDVLPLPYLIQFNEVNSAPFAESVNATDLPTGTFPTLAYSNSAGSSDTFRQAYFEPRPRRSYVMQWNLTVEHAVNQWLNITSAFVGSRGVHQPFRVEDADIVLPVLTTQGYVWPAAGTGHRLNPHAGRITAGYWRSDAYYDALDLKIQGKWRNATIETSYTWGKTIDTSSTSIVGDEYANSVSSPLFFNPTLNRGPADFNIEHNLEINSSWELGTPKLASQFARFVSGGWQVGGIFEASTGVPFTPLVGGDALGLKSTDPGLDVPDLLHGAGCGAPVNSGNPNHYIKVECFAFPTPATRLGNLGRNTVVGPGLLNVDLSFIKNTSVKRLSDAFNVQFRAEVFNGINHTNFAPPLDHKELFDATGQRLSSAGVIDSTQTSSRQIQFAIKTIW